MEENKLQGTTQEEVMVTMVKTIQFLAKELETSQKMVIDLKTAIWRDKK